MEYRRFIAQHPRVLNGEPFIRGTAIRVRDILEALANGASPEQIKQKHPQITDESIGAVVSFMADSLNKGELLSRVEDSR